MKSTILLALVATGCAIPLTEKVAALNAIDEDVRSFKEGLTAIEKSLHTLKAAASSAIEKSRMLPAGAAPRESRFCQVAKLPNGLVRCGQVLHDPR
jgi:hypothetical protein